MFIYLYILYRYAHIHAYYQHNNKSIAPNKMNSKHPEQILNHLWISE